MKRYRRSRKFFLRHSSRFTGRYCDSGDNNCLFYTDGRKADRDIICKLSGDAAGGRQIVQKAGGDSAEVPNYNG